MGQPLTPVNLVNAFNSQVAHEITQEEMDWALQEMENEEMMDDMYLATFDARYVKTIEEENALLRGQLAHVQNLYNTELIKNQALIDCLTAVEK